MVIQYCYTADPQKKSVRTPSQKERNKETIKKIEKRKTEKKKRLGYTLK